MPAGAVSTPAAQQISGLTINAKPVKTVQELQAAFDAIEAGTTVKMAFKSKGKDLVVEGVAKAAK